MLPQAQLAATVVVCEDDEPTLGLLCDHLEADRFRALPAPSASDALRLCHYKQPDLLLLDLRLPDASGLDVLREIRASEGATGRYDPALPVIVLSGRGTDADRVRGFAEGADDYVVKAAQSAEGPTTRTPFALSGRVGSDAIEGAVALGGVLVGQVTHRHLAPVGTGIVQLSRDLP